MNHTPDHPRKVLLAGATGLIGGLLLQGLLAHPAVTEVHALVRRPMDAWHAKLHLHQVDFTALAALPEVDEVYLALGTTIRLAGSQAAFRAVDLHANLAVAEAAVKAGARRVGLVSAAGASSNSAVFYNRVKGELEDALKAMELDALVIARPSLLLDSRAHLGQAPRLAEKLSIPIGRLIAPWVPGAYRPVYAQSVSTALLQRVPVATGLLVLPSDELARSGFTGIFWGG
ncbi:NAD(P)H-binding protein [Serpentinimonas maccroryi]|uniref:NAD(P)H-binding protein n=1 Tax=Serpentinimonas maccroryi TaxID=1458426 RepID=UPI0020337F98|nr:NAD(P)H-binding protein [Serpentinimonas maccroryi]MCM2478318.1 NAD(P)H-binding protein [Serpentinimonas maccroryi]